MLTIDEKRELVRLADERAKRRKRRRLFSYTPYPKQLEFHAAGKIHRERCLMAGNQQGKTWSMGFELAMHLTGRYPKAGEVFYPSIDDLEVLARSNLKLAVALHENLTEHGLLGADVYPDGWPGHRFDRPIWAWAASVGGKETRDNPQRILIGHPTKKEEWGMGAIPHEDLINDKGEMSYRPAQGTADAVDYIMVNNINGGQSVLQLKSYLQGRESWQGPTIDFVWYDEEPPMDIYEEGITRTNTTLGPNVLTFTPLMGMSKVVQLFLGTEEPDDLAPPEEVE